MESPEVEVGSTLLGEQPPEYIERCLRGEALWGDELDAESIERWFASEQDGYRRIREARERAGEARASGTHYDAINNLLGFRHLAAGRVGRAMALGGYDGSDLRPIWSRLDDLTVLEPAFGDRQEVIDGLSVRHVVPAASGVTPFDDEEFDLVTAFGVLHHIPNVTVVLGELVRVLKPGGLLMVREPSVAMGDWRTRVSDRVTPNERGLPKAWLERTIAQLPVEVLANEAWGFPLIPRGGHKLGLEVPYSHRSLALMDVVLSRVLAFNATYHRRTRLAKLSPAAFFLVARRTQ